MSHKVFVSYHHQNDSFYKDEFDTMFSNVIISKSVDDGDIAPNLPDDTIRQKIRDEYLRDSTVTVVLIGAETWKRKHVDWEIASSIRQTLYSSRSGLLGILIPSYHNFHNIENGKFNHNTIPPRLSDNIKCGFAKIYEWSDNSPFISRWINDAYNVREKVEPDNSYPSFKYNKSGVRWQ
jgi:hypothetical protein|tara:strand:- start:5074 stop:5610 length:537 start_codon:yes stop_codon:yes gene_type:complete